MTHGRYEVTYYYSSTTETKRYEHIEGIRERAVDFAQFLTQNGFFPVVVYDKVKQEWVET